MRNCYENIPSNQIEPYGFIYLTTNLVNEKKYIGQRKITNHYGDDDNYLGSGVLITKAIAKYGRENFHRDILEYVFTMEEMDDREKYYIYLYNAVEDDNFYNISSGGKTYYPDQEHVDNWIEKMKIWRSEHPDEHAEACRKAQKWRNDEAKAADCYRRVGEKNRTNLKRYYEEHTDEFLKRYEKAIESRKKYYQEHPEEEAQRIQKVLDKQYERTIFPLVCIERNEIYVAMWHAKHLIKRTAENIKRHLDGMYKWCGKDPETGIRLHWRVATIEDLNNIPFAKGGEAYEQLCREFLSDSSRQAV